MARHRHSFPTGYIYGVIFTALIILLFFTNLAIGSVRIPLRDVIEILFDGYGNVKESWRFIVLESRLPGAITATLAGSSLAVSGLMLQTAFRNPLADPSIFGISSGAGLGAALVILFFGGSIGIGSFTYTGFIAVLISAFAGAMAVTFVILAFATIVRNSVMLLIIGIMIGYLSSSAISLLNYFATEEGVKSYIIWGMGNFSGVSNQFIPALSTVSGAGILLSLLLIKPLNALLLGDNYAANLGVNIRLVRYLLLFATGMLTAVVTAFCGPVAFIGLAVPHIARMLLCTDDHRVLMPSTILLGAVVALLCNIVCVLPSDGSIIPLNVVTPIIGAPVIIYVIVKSKI